MTMPVIHALKHCTESERQLLVNCVGNKSFTAESHATLLEILNRYDAFAATRRYAAERSAAASSALEPFADSTAKRTLLWIAETLLTRRH